MNAPFSLLPGTLIWSSESVVIWILVIYVFGLKVEKETYRERMVEVHFFIKVKFSFIYFIFILWLFNMIKISVDIISLYVFLVGFELIM